MPLTAKQPLPRWYLHAQTFERAGVIEMPGPQAHPTILSFFAYTTLKSTEMARSDETSWCSAFICAVMEQCKIKSTKSAAARSWEDWGIPLATPKPGCVVVLKRYDPKNKKAGHVGLWTGHSEPQYIEILGGNQSNRVCTKLYPSNDVLAYRWPIAEPMT